MKEDADTSDSEVDPYLSLDFEKNLVKPGDSIKKSARTSEGL